MRLYFLLQRNLNLSSCALASRSACRFHASQTLRSGPPALAGRLQSLRAVSALHESLGRVKGYQELLDSAVKGTMAHRRQEKLTSDRVEYHGASPSQEVP